MLRLHLAQSGHFRWAMVNMLPFGTRRLLVIAKSHRITDFGLGLGLGTLRLLPWSSIKLIEMIVRPNLSKRVVKGC